MITWKEAARMESVPIFNVHNNDITHRGETLTCEFFSTAMNTASECKREARIAFHGGL